MSLYSYETSSVLERAIDKATDPSLSSENWEYILDVCDKVNDDPENGPHEAIQIVTRNLEGTNSKKQNYSLVLLSSLAQNCGPLMHKEIASKTLTSQLLELGTDTQASESVRVQVFEVMETLSREFRNDPSLRQVEDTFNRLKQTDPNMIPPAVPQKHQITEQDRQREEEELRRVLALSLEESQEDPRYSDFGQSNASSSYQFQPQSQSQVQNEAFQQPSQVSQQSQPPQPQQAQPQQPQQSQPAQPQQDLLSADLDAPQSATGKTASTVNRVRAIYDLTSEEAGELTFRRGDIITVLESVYRDWWKGSLRGEIGIFPLNYVTPIADPTPQELAQEARDELSVLSEARNIEKILAMLKSAEKQNPRPKIAENEELQNLYQTSQALRPKLVKLIEKLSQKRDDLIDLDNKFMSARRSYDGLIDGEVSQVTTGPNQPPHSASNPFQRVPQSGPSQQQHQGPAQAPYIPGQSPTQGMANLSISTESGPQGFNNNSGNAEPQGFGPNVTGPQGYPSGNAGYQGFNAGNPSSGSYGAPTPAGYPTQPTSPIQQQQQQGQHSQPNQWSQPGNTPNMGNMQGSYGGPESSQGQPQQGQVQGQYGNQYDQGSGQYGPGASNLINLSGANAGNTPENYNSNNAHPSTNVANNGNSTKPGRVPTSYGQYNNNNNEGGQSTSSSSSHLQLPHQQQPQQQGFYSADNTDTPSFLIPAGTGMDDSNFQDRRPSNKYPR